MKQGENCHVWMRIFLTSTIISIIRPAFGIKFTPVVKTKAGPVVGQFLSRNGYEFAQFLGIPYAKPPVGELRLQPPKPIEKWTEVIETIEDANHCWQPRVSIGAKRWKMSEDCLYLNVNAPASVFKQSNSKLLPVVFSCDIALDNTFAGAFMTENITYPFVSRENIIYVNSRYRTGFFGFPYTSNPDDGIVSNLGLMDQNFVLNWIKENIKNFGGDPNQVTIIGEASSANLAGGHAYSPYARGLFQNLVMINRQIFATINQEFDPIRVEESTNIVIDRVGCSKAKNLLDCLQQVDAKTIVSAYPRRQYAFSAVSNGDYVPDDYLSRGPLEVNVLMGYVDNLGSSKLVELGPEILSKQDLTRDDAKNVISKIYEGDSVDTILDMYLGSPVDDQSVKSIQEGVIRFLTDLFYACPTFDLAEILAQSLAENNIYVFQFDHMVNSHIYQLCDLQPETRGCNGDLVITNTGLPFVSDYNWSSVFTPEDKFVSQKMMDSYANFVRTGRPVKDNNQWPSWTNSKSDQVNAVAAILSASDIQLDRNRPEYCLQNKEKLTSNIIPKLYLGDPYPLEEQQKIDRDSSYEDYLYNVYKYWAIQQY
ncbi:carboxylic ester hydrolase-like [Brevipalpus obovatus]|uniref:carboxylic ester hydrolase-like n=1 Tax=Brevipalpus obovatus TaxID=246614 RepID=UPI003D9E9008